MMCGSIFGSGQSWSGSERRRWPIRGFRSGSCGTWSEHMAEVIVALDLPSGAEALELLDRLPEARWVKVGSILMTREGPPLVRALIGRGLRVFLD
ncbi:MAG: orotidine 5'-phosphate decarboxylase / HUMPS family protein, partial [Gemmatimonadales bacterium]